MTSSNSGIAHLSEIGVDVWIPRVIEDHQFQCHFFFDDSGEYSCCVVIKAGNEAAEKDAAHLLDNMMRATGLSRRSLIDDSLVNANPKKLVEGTTSLEETLKCHTPDSLLLSGFKIHQLIVGANEKKKSRNVINLGNLSIKFWSVESAFALLEKPARKREAWQVLKQLQASVEKVETL